MNSSNNIFQTTDCLSQEQLIRYVKGEMTKEEMRVVELHLADCEICSEAVEGLMLTPKSNLGSIEDDLQKRIHVLTDGSQNKKVIPFYGRWYSMAAAIALLFLVSLYLVNTFKQNNTSNYAVNKLPEISSKEQSGADLQKRSATDSQLLQSIAAPVLKSAEKHEISESENQSHQEISKQKFEQAVQKNELEETTGDAASVAMAEENKGLSGTALDDRNAVYKDLNEKAVAAEAINRDQEVVPSQQQQPLFKSVDVTSAKKNKARADAAKPSTVAPAALNETATSAPAFDFELYDKGMRDFNDSNYESSGKIFNQLLHKQPDNINANYYAGVSEYELKNYTEAIQHLDVVIDNKRNSFYESALWYKAQCYIKTDKKTEAKKTLESIVKFKGNYKTQAGELLKEL